MLRIPAAFCLGDRDLCCCEKCVDKCPEYNFVGTTMSRPSCEKPGSTIVTGVPRVQMVIALKLRAYAETRGARGSDRLMKLLWSQLLLG